ncbi:MAG: hypothetical protein IRY89_09130 [Pseudolabrys sp.]|nr:hypothetical protein [Pseudolabrys sp.]
MSSPTETIAAEGEIQEMLARAVRLYARRAEQGDAPAAFPPGADMTATEVLVTVSAMLRAVNVQVFELGMWQAWSGR